uniref:Smr/MutS family protein n=1 Tax=Brachyspira sp. TaxID=1977261 RepID=UPI003D7D3AE1
LNNNIKNHNDNNDDNYCSEEDKEMFLNAIKNLDCSNHIKNLNESKKNYSKFKPNIKTVKPQDSLDLHGLTRERALQSIKKFIFEAKKNNLKVVLIIHGKGFRSENKIAVLKDLVEYYIATEGKYYIKYSAEAPARLGGSGAKLIYLL